VRLSDLPRPEKLIAASLSPAGVVTRRSSDGANSPSTAPDVALLTITSPETTTAD